MHNFSEDCVLVVLASDYYDEKDYVRDYDEFWRKLNIMLDISKIKIEIITKQNVPININNPILKYTQNKERKSDRLFVQVFYDEIKIGEGIILDFYKQFEVVEDFGIAHTKVISFEHKGSIKFKNTYFGNMVYRIKNFKDPKIDDDEKEKYIKEITAIFETYLSSLKDSIDNLKITYVPSSSKIPDEIAFNLSQSSKKELVKIVDKNPDDTIDSKSITTFEESIKHAKIKYTFDEHKIKQNSKSRFLIIDDVFGNGSSIFTILKKLYDITNMLNYFFIVVKDVKR